MTPIGAKGRSEAGPVDQRAVREHNLGVVMRHLATHGPRSRARVAAETGLNKTTVSSLVAELIERGLLCETGMETPGAVGRPGRKVQLAGGGVTGIGLEVGEWHLAAYAVDLTGSVRYEAVVQSPNRSLSPERAIASLGDLTTKALGALGAQGLTPAGVTVALPGLVDISRGMLFVAPNLDWRELPVVDMLSDHLGPTAFPIRADNDANLAALAELREGVGRRLRDFVYVHGELGAGVGAGIVAGGELFRGRSGFSGEIGHMPLARRGPPCRCGNRGCLEVLAGREALLRLVGLDVHSDTDVRADAAQEELLRRARAGDAATLRALAEVGRALAAGLTSLANVLSPEAIVLGGYFATFAEWLAPRIERELDDHVLGARWSHCELHVSKLGDQATLRGAAALALHEVLTNPASVRCVIENSAPMSRRANFGAMQASSQTKT